MRGVHEWQGRGQSVAVLMRACMQVSPDHAGSLAQAQQAPAAGEILPAVGVRRVGIVIDLQVQALGLPGDLQTRVGGFAGVSKDVGQPFLHDPVGGQIDASIEASGGALSVDGDEHAGGAK